MDNFIDKLEDKLAVYASRINDLEDRLNELERSTNTRKRPRTETDTIRVEDIPDRLDYHQFRDLIQRYGDSKVFVSRTDPRWAQITYKNPRNAEALIADADKLGMKIFYKCEEN
jgi:hypothetical protein